MAGQIEHEMTDCLQQMAHLQAKMEVLQQEKNNKAAEEVVKQQKVEPNLGIMSNWLDEYGEMIDEVERERVIMEQYNELTRVLEIPKSYGLTKEEYEAYKNKEEITEKYLSLQNKKQSTKTNKKYYRGLGETRASVVGRDGNESQPYQLSRAQLLSNSPNFIPGNHQPTYFMKQYIEATYNMFVIQQKRINELETIIKKIEMNSA